MREMTFRVAGASLSQNFKNNSFSSTVVAPGLFDLLALHFLAVQRDHNFDDLALLITVKPYLCTHVGYCETAVIFRLQFLLGVTLWLAKQLVTLVCYDQDAYRGFVLTNEVVKCLRIDLSRRNCRRRWFFVIRFRRIGGLRSVGWFLSLGLARLIVGQPLDVDCFRAPPLFFFYKPLSALVPWRPTFGIDVTERAVLSAELLRLSQQ